MPHQHLTTRTIPFADTDLAGIVHFTHFLRYMEDTEHDFYRVLGLSVHAETETGWIGWPRIEVQCRYVRPLRFEEVVEVQLLLVEMVIQALVQEVQEVLVQQIIFQEAV